MALSDYFSGGAGAGEAPGGQLLNTDAQVQKGREASLMQDIQRIMGARQGGGGGGGGGGRSYNFDYEAPKDPMGELIQRLSHLRGKNAAGPWENISTSQGLREARRQEANLLENYLMNTGVLSNPFDMSNMFNRGGGAQQMFKQGPEYQDPYKDVREAAIQAAMGYLQKDSPHLLSSLKRR